MAHQGISRLLTTKSNTVMTHRKVSHEFTQTDLDEALKQVERAALRYDKNSPSCMGLDAFEGASMAPHVFKEQVSDMRCFYIA